MVRTQIQLTEEQAREIKKIAAQKGVAMAEVIRGAVEETIQSRSLPVSEERRRRALAVIGKFRSGKQDISEEHDAYLAETLSP
jgi:hypothetical protein